MIPHPLSLIPSLAIGRVWLASSLAYLLSACGAPSAPIGDTEQPFAAGDRNDESGQEEASSDACADGVAGADPAIGDCPIVARELCFSTPEAACTCAGCGLSKCAIAESFPAQAICPGSGGGSDPDGSTSDDPNTPVSSAPQGGGSNGSSGNSPGCTDPAAPVCSGGVPRDPTGADRCDFIVGDTCFDSAANACACAGCGEDRCLVLESYPAQIRCE
jgi:hypothetical protein